MLVLLVVLTLGALLPEAVANGRDELQPHSASTTDTLGAGATAIPTGNAAHAVGTGSSAPQQHTVGPTGTPYCSHTDPKGLCILAAHHTTLQAGAGHQPRLGPCTGEAAVARTEGWLCPTAAPAPLHQDSLPSNPWAA